MNQSATRRQLAIFMAERLAAEPKQRSVWIQRLAAYLVKTNRVAEVDLLMNDIAHELQARSGYLSVELESARPLSAATRQAITNRLQAATGAKDISLHQVVTPDLVGGFVARTPDGELNASLRHGLRKLAAIA